MRCAYTAPRLKKLALLSPAQHAPISPRGEVRHNALKLARTARAGCGAVAVLNSTGTSASE